MRTSSKRPTVAETGSDHVHSASPSKHSRRGDTEKDDNSTNIFMTGGLGVGGSQGRGQFASRGNSVDVKDEVEVVDIGVVSQDGDLDNLIVLLGVGKS